MHFESLLFFENDVTSVFFSRVLLSKRLDTHLPGFPFDRYRDETPMHRGTERIERIFLFPLSFFFFF